MSSVTLGLWPIAGITTVGVTESNARATVQAAIECGVTSFDTAFSYGYDGESDRLLGDCLGSQRDRFRIIGKVGQRWTADRIRVNDGSPATLIGDAETSLRRMRIEQFDLLMLHIPDPRTPIELSAGALGQLKQRGLCRQIGVCNVTIKQLHDFRSAATCDAIQCPLNLIQRHSLDHLIPQCAIDGIEVQVFWVLMKGLLAGKITRDHRFAAGDSRPGYDIFQGQLRSKTHDVLDGMQKVAERTGLTISQLSIGWALSQAGVSSALVGAHRPQQIRETALARPLGPDEVAMIDDLACH